MLTVPRSVQVNPFAEYCHLPVAATVDPVTAMLKIAAPSGSLILVWVSSAVAATNPST